MLTLWDLFKPPKHRPRARPSPPRPQVVVEPPRPPQPGSPSRQTMSERYEHLTREMLQSYGVRVRKWRSSMSGVAWQVHYKDGTVSRLIETPRPKGPMSCAIFLHEIGHHAIGFDAHRLRCVEEYHAWQFAIDTMERLEFNITERVRKRMHDSLRYAVQKANRRGLRQVPEILLPYAEPLVQRSPHVERMPVEHAGT